MSRENVEIVRRFHAAFNARDAAGMLAVMDPEIVFVPILARLEGVEYHGHREVTGWMAELDRDWAEFHTDPIEFQDHGDVVLQLGTWHARARASGVALDSQPGAWVTFLRDAKIVRHETFTDRDQARTAAAAGPLD
jgi:ketosteroid isomerase-like protein